MKYIFLIASILTSFIAFQTHSFANGGPVERVDPVPQLSPELQKITDHNYDYPYSKNYTYPDQIYERRKRIENDIYSNYIRERIPESGSGIAKHFQEDSQIYELALKIGLCQKITDAEVEAIKDRINKKYSGDTLLELAVSQMNLEAIDLLFKYGADPFISYEEGNIYVDRSDLAFMDKMSDTFNPGFSVDVIRLFVKYKLNPNHVNNRKIDHATSKDHDMTFLAYMVLIHNELAWVSLMEGGGNPWLQWEIAGEPKSIVSHSVMGLNLPFLDYIIENGYLETASKEDIDELIDVMTTLALRSDLYTQNRQRQLRSIVAKRGIIPSQEILDYINWVPSMNDVK
ncbi:hypothetical protein [Bartonella sp. HY406]|uniref:hypothetical protein n=1 Tax=Bartonella sp. HY406 TaxID=2979331 RepID=UPI0021C57F7B|nr:hypothetical protein [Bartonella sp. HY406]UXN04229.1 hypothetical protein N6B01_04130 [Bartonella sp. HY406]